MCGTFEPLPSLLMGEGPYYSALDWLRRHRAPSPTPPPSPAKGEKGIDLPSSALPQGEGRGEGIPAASARHAAPS